jgi:virulence-associated protein VapD
MYSSSSMLPLLFTGTVTACCLYSRYKTSTMISKQLLSVGSLVKIGKQMYSEQVSSNPNYEQAYSEMKRILQQLNLFDERQDRVYVSAVKYASTLCPDATPYDLTTYALFEWFTLYFDDLLEKNPTYSDATKRDLLISACLDMLKYGSINVSVVDTVAEASSFIEYFKVLRERSLTSLGETIGHTWINRFHSTVHEWLTLGSVPAIDYLNDKKYHSSQQVLSIRRYDINILQIFDLQELVKHIQIPDSLYNDADFQLMRIALADVIALMNDLLSYGKEKVDEYPFNYVIALEKEGHSTTDAANLAMDLLNEKVKLFESAEANLIQRVVDSNVKQDLTTYIKGMKMTLQIAIGFSLKSGRYNHPNSLFEELSK